MLKQVLLIFHSQLGLLCYSMNTDLPCLVTLAQIPVELLQNELQKM